MSGVPAPDDRTSRLSHTASGFAAGFFAVPLFHQLALMAVAALLAVPLRTFSLAPVEPLGVPQVVSTAFWGGVWGIALAWTLRRLERRDAGYLLAGLVFGALLPSLVGWWVIAPLRGNPPMAGGDATRIVVGLVVNGAWGLGTAVLLVAYRRLASKRATVHRG
jgi:hypothetical protein